jgi:flavin reductase (DIM6/NTAB) family NADH-FMN oxidoreductase RutF
MFYEPSKGHGLPHDPFKAIVAPRPIGWISTISALGGVNLAPYSFFNVISPNPLMVWFSSGGAKDSVTYARDTGEFVANLVGRDLAGKMNETSVDAPRGVSEFEHVGLIAAPCFLVRPPRVANAPAALECKVTDIYEPVGLNGRRSRSQVVIGEVVGVHIGDEFLKDGMFDVVKAGNVARLGYFDFSTTEQVFPLRRPKWSEDAV